MGRVLQELRELSRLAHANCVVLEADLAAGMTPASLEELGASRPRKRIHDLLGGCPRRSVWWVWSGERGGDREIEGGGGERFLGTTTVSEHLESLVCCGSRDRQGTIGQWQAPVGGPSVLVVPCSISASGGVIEQVSGERVRA